MDEKAGQEVIERMQTIAELLKIETGKINLYTRPSVGDFDYVKRWAWDMYRGNWRSGGVVVCEIHDTVFDPSTELIRSFAHNMTRERSPYGEYERLAEQAYRETPPPATEGYTKPPRESEKTLLNDLVLLYAEDAIYDAEPDEIPSTDDVLAAVLSPERLDELKQDIEIYRGRIAREHANSD